jgi:hypothetical protein
VTQRPKRDFEVRIPARFLKEPTISPNAKVLRAAIGAFADGKTGVTFVQPKKLEKTLSWGRRRRERAQAELVKAGWLRLKLRRGAHGRWARRIYELCEPSTVARFERSGEKAQLISHHSQSQVKSSDTTSLIETQNLEQSRNARVT